MYMTHGVFTRTAATEPGATNAPTILTAGVARFDTQTRKLEVFAEGTSNPWGVDFDARGNAFVSACVIDHLFHLAPGGIYARQAGQPPHPYAYELLPSIVDFKHHMAAFAGVNVYQGDQWPASWKGEILVGNIHQNALNNDHVETKGASFKASKRPNFLTTKDGWFMPVSTQTGPDGAVWVMDWYDKYPCYQNANADPAGVDRERGRIWRVVWTGDQPGKPVPSHPEGLNLGKASSADLVQTLAHPIVWQRRMAQRVLNGRSDTNNIPLITKMIKEGPTVDARLAAFWTLFSSGLMSENRLELASNSTEPALRAWSLRFTGERRQLNDASAARIVRLAADPDPTVRSAAAVAMRYFTSFSLTVDTRPPLTPLGMPIGAVMANLVEGSKAGDDSLINFQIWHAMEPLIAKRTEAILQYFSATGTNNLPLSAKLLTKITRRICDLRSTPGLDRALEYLDQLPDDDKSVQLGIAALDGLIEGQRGKAVTPTKPTAPVLEKLRSRKNPDLVARAQQIGSLWGDAAAVKATVGRIKDPALPIPDRIKAIQSSRQNKGEDVRNTIMGVINQPGVPEEVMAGGSSRRRRASGSAKNASRPGIRPRRRARSANRPLRLRGAVPSLGRVGSFLPLHETFSRLRKAHRRTAAQARRLEGPARDARPGHFLGGGDPPA